MRCCLLFHRELEPDAPEAYEVLRFQEDARKSGIDLQVLQPREFDLLVDSTNNWSTMYQDKKLDKPDLIIPRTGSETSYFTLAVLRHFEVQGVSMINRPAAIETVADKLHTLQILAGAGLPVPKTILGKFPVDVDLVEHELGFPVVVKTLKGTRGEGVLLCSNREQFNDLASLLDGAKPGADFIFQRYIAESHGRDVRVLVIDCKAVAAMERRSPTADSRQTYRSAGSLHPLNYRSRWLISPSVWRMSWGWMSRVSTSCLTRTAIAFARPIRRQVSRGWRRFAR
jgi:gamma-F420-2:alpha-L-glutamate ligase